MEIDTHGTGNLQNKSICHLIVFETTFHPPVVTLQLFSKSGTHDI